MMKTYDLNIEVITPIHIGDAQGRLSPLEFFQDQHAIYLVHEKTWAQKLASIQGIDSFISYVESNERASLDGFLLELGPSKEKHMRQGTFLRRIPKGERFLIKNFQPFIFDRGILEPYIPGTSLKGAIRASILFHLSGNSSKFAEIKSLALRKDRRASAKADELLRARLETRGRWRVDPQTDWLRFLQVTDAYPLQTNSSEVRAVKIVSLNLERGYHFSARDAQIFVETIKPGSKFSARVKLDQDGWQILKDYYGEKTPFILEDWLELGSEKTKALSAEEKEFYQQADLSRLGEELEYCEKQGANLRLGWGSGLAGTSLVLRFSPHERQTLRQQYFQRRRHHQFPQSRKVVMDNNLPSHSLGWIRLSLS